MIRVCLVAPQWMTGGQAVEAQTLLHGFANDPDIRVEIQPIDPRIPGFLAAIPGLRTLCRMPLYHAGLLRRILRSDVVHVFTAAFWPFMLTTTPAILYGRLLGRPVVLNYRDGRARDHLKYGVVRWILRRATVLVFPSGFLRDMFAEFGLEGQVVSNVVDTSRFVYRERDPLRPVLISSRLLEELYAVENTILAFELVRREHPDARLLVVGDGDQRAALEELVRQRQIPGVEFVGRVPHQEMGKWFDEADIMVNSSRIDNMPHCLIEAFAAGLPVVTTPSGGIPYIVHHEVNGLHVPVGGPAAMAAAVGRILGDHELATNLVTSGRWEVDAKYSWIAARAEWITLYRNCRASHT
ncbi:MAG: glycosyltransferase family 4 protein [Gemmatimonadales bacterium]